MLQAVWRQISIAMEKEYEQVSVPREGVKENDREGGLWKRNRTLPCRIGERKANKAEKTEPAKIQRLTT